ncbi:MAG: RNA polymerase subunit sigma, partial [Myxococcota bacterium]
IDYMRCGRDCSIALYPMPDGVDVRWSKGRSLAEREHALLVCPRCGDRSRPHVLWFDESYDEARFRFESSIDAATNARLLVVVGTAGQTNLPLQIGALVFRRGAPMIAINLDPSPFTEMAEQSPHGLFLQGTAGDQVPPLVEHIVTALG